MPSSTTTGGTKTDMTVHGINSGNSGKPSDPDSPSTEEDSPDVKEIEIPSNQENSSNHQQLQQRTSCFFEWRLLPQHKIEKDGELSQNNEDNNVEENSTFCKFKCDLCLGMYLYTYSLFKNRRFMLDKTV